jgi:hypothetical protein
MAANDFYVDAAAGSDNNGGTSAGSAKASGTAGSTNGTATVDLSGDTPDLSGVVVGDCIRIAGEVNGRRSTDLFEITAVDDDLDTVNVTPTPGTASGLTWAIGGALATIGRFAAVTVSGDADKAWVKASADYNETVTIAAAGIGTVTAPNVVEGYTTTPGDGGRIVIHGQTTRTNGITTAVTSGIYFVFKNIRVRNHTGNGVQIVDHVVFKNCMFDHNGIDGINGDDWCRFEECEFSDNTSNGVLVDKFAVFVGCRAYRNAGEGIGCESGVIFGCVAYSNGINGIRMDGLGGVGTVCAAINNTVDGDGKDTDVGILMSPAENTVDVCINNIVYDCATGLQSRSGQGELLISRNNLLNSNTANYADGGATYTGEVLDAPDFVDEAALDYRPNNTSPAVGAGFDESTLEEGTSGMDIGGRQRTEAAAGASAITPPLYPWHVGGA